MRNVSTCSWQAGVRAAVGDEGGHVSTEDQETPPIKGEVALSEEETQAIAINFYRGLFGDYEMNRLLETVRIQRNVLKTLFSYWNHEPLRLVAVADSVRVTTLADLKRLAGIEPA
jgi:hypothetical protein